MVAMSKSFPMLEAATAAASMAIGESGRSDAHRAGLPARGTARRGFFASRCKAEGGGKKPLDALLRQDDRGAAGPD
ncbi:hypothetical protein [Sphingobium indicum]